MKFTRLEREGAVKLTADPQLIEHFKELGYVETDTEIVPDPVAEAEGTVEDAAGETPTTIAEEKSLFDKMTNAELTDFIISRGASVPNGATKTVLIDIAKTLEG